MDDIATQFDHSATLCTQRARHEPFSGPVDVDDPDYTWWDEPQDAFHTTHSPLSVTGFVRLGGLNRAISTARKNGTHRGSSQQVADDVLPPTYVQPPFRAPESDAGVSGGNGHEAESLASPTASSALIGASVPPQTDTLGTTPEAGCNAITGAIEDDSAPKLSDAGIAEPSPAAAESCPFQQLQDLSNRVKAGDDSAIAEIQKILNSNDALWRHLGDVERSTEAWLIEVADGPAASKESVRRSVAAMKQSLLGERPTPLERMAVGRVLACWLFAHFADRFCSLAIKQGGRASDLAKLLEASEKRYGTALKSLKLVQGI